MVVKKIALSQQKKKIVPQKAEIDKMVSFFYHTYKGQGARNLELRGSAPA